MISEQLAWAILFLPLASFLVTGLVIRPFLGARYARLSGYVTVLAIGASFILALLALRSTIVHEDPIGWPSHTWLTIGPLEIRIGILMDSLTAIMLVVVTGVSFLVQVYSLEYMRSNSDALGQAADGLGYSRFFAFMSLFTTAMVGVVTARSILQIYVFWELVGLCSYLLIGFWYHRPSAAAAAKKAFIVTRIGDVGFLLAILYLFLQKDQFIAQGLNPFEIPDIWKVAAVLPSFAVTWLALGIFAGAMGKSGQFPLHTWLPDAMEGPTPVSALIHAATMVAAGVFLVARFFPVFEESRAAMTTVALVGGFTAVFAATMGLVMYDIKRVMAYSTISQLGYMMLALGVGAPAVAIFHLFNHAFFKALLFLGAGSVNHATGTYDMRYMGGLRRHMPITYVTLLIGGLSLAGIFPLSGFWSKDEILLEAWRGTGPMDHVVFWLALAGVFLTAFYMARLMFMTFHGSFRGGVAAEGHGQDAGHAVHLAESPWLMLLPLLVLAVASVGSGYLANPTTAVASIPAHWFIDFMGGHAQGASLTLALVSTVVALAGIGLATLMYQTKVLSPQKVGASLGSLHSLLSHKYYMDTLYEDIIVTRVFYKGVARFTDWVDREVIDRTMDIIGSVGRNGGRILAPIQNGQVQGYGVVITFGMLLIIGAYLVFGR